MCIYSAQAHCLVSPLTQLLFSRLALFPMAASKNMKAKKSMKAMKAMKAKSMKAKSMKAKRMTAKKSMKAMKAWTQRWGEASSKSDFAILSPPYSDFIREMWNSRDRLRLFLHS